MGGNSSKTADILKYVHNEWQPLGQFNGNKLVRNRETDKMTQIHSFLLDPKRNLQEEFQIYNYRRTQDKALVSVHAVESMKSQDNMVCGNQQIIKVLVEHIPVRCEQIPSLPLGQSLYMLSETLLGFDDCYDKIGPFEITQNMIGVNSEGHVKIWLNENYADNHPLFARPPLQMTTGNREKDKSFRDQREMVQSLLRIVERKCQNGRFPEEFRYNIYNTSTFEVAYSEIQQYCNARQLQIPEKLMFNTHNFALLSNSKNFGDERRQNQPLPIQPYRDSIASNLEPKQTFINNLVSSDARHQSFQPFRSQQLGEMPNVRKYESNPLNPYPVSYQSMRLPQPVSPRQSGQINISYQNPRITNQSYSTFGYSPR